MAIANGLQILAESRFDHADNELLGLVDAVARRVDAEVVVDGGTPLIAGVAVVEVSVRLVLALHELRRFLKVQRVHLH